MELHEIEQEFNKIWNRADYKQKQQLLREVDKIINRKESEKKQIEAFFQAVKNENISVVRKILKQGVNVNEADDLLGNTALTHAIISRNFEIIKLLLNSGADPTIKNQRGYSSLDATKLMGNEELKQLFDSYK